VLHQLPEHRIQLGIAVAQRPGPHHFAAAQQRAEQSDDQGVDVEQRQRREHHRVLVERNARGHHPGVDDFVGVRVRGEPGSAGGAAGVEVGGQVVGGQGLDVHQPVGGMGRGKLREVADAYSFDGLQRGGGPVGLGGGQRQQCVQPQGLGDLPGRGPHLSVQLRTGGDEHPRAAAPQQLLDVFGRQARIHRGGDARGLRGQQGRRQLRGVRCEQTHSDAAGDAEGAQQVGGAMDLVAQLREGHGGGAEEACGVGQHCQGRAVGP